MDRSVLTAKANGRLTSAERTALLWLQGVVLVQFVCQIALLFEQLSQLRAVFRTALFAVNLIALVMVPGRSVRHPSRFLALIAVAVLAVNVFHPSTNSPLVGFAQTGLYLAVLAPLFWVTRLTVTPVVLARVFLMVWAFHALSAGVGVLQSLFPGRFQPAVSTVIQEMGVVAEGLKIELADGTQMWRPMGLTDTPGGAATSGLYAAMFGMGYLALSRRWSLRAAGAVAIIVGLYCIYLSQIRSILVVYGIVAVVFAGGLLALRQFGAAVRLMAVLPILVIGGFAWAYAVGGESMAARMETLVEGRATDVYYSNRGHFLEYTVTELLPEYPMGAGLGRWGMMRYHFGDPTGPQSDAIWVEIQWTGWLLDGGVPLILTYVAAVGAAVWAAARAARRARDPWLAGWSALMVAYGVAVAGLTFNYVPFVSQAGLEFWFLNAALFTTVARQPRPRPPAPPTD